MRYQPKIKVIGIGGAGGNTISRLKKLKAEGVELIALNTDAQDLKKTKAHLKIRIGKKLTQGLGTGMDWQTGERAVMEQKEEIKEVLKDADLVFITLGLGGGTGSGGAPVIAEICRELKILTLVVATIPFSFEGELRKKIAQITIEKLRQKVDSLILIPNDKLLESFDFKISVSEAFWRADEILREAILGIIDLVSGPGLINVDFGNLKTILKNSGKAYFGIGKGFGEKRIEKATNSALFSPLIEISPKKAKGVLFNVSGREISLGEVEQIAQFLSEKVHPEAKIIFGAKEDLSLKKGEIKVILILTNFNDSF